MNYIISHKEEIIIVAILVFVICLMFYILHSKKRRLKLAFYINFIF